MNLAVEADMNEAPKGHAWRFGLRSLVMLAILVAVTSAIGVREYRAWVGRWQFPNFGGGLQSLVYDRNYLIGSILSLVLWAMFFVVRREGRWEMIFSSTLAVAIALVQKFLWSPKDWWRPELYDQMIFGYEDLMYAFSAAGVLAVLYPALLWRNLVMHAGPKSLAVRVMPPLLDFALPGAGLAWMLALRRDLWRAALATTLMVVAISPVCFWLAEWVLPTSPWRGWHPPNEWTLQFWLHDVRWYAYAAAFYGVYYKFVRGLGVAMTSKRTSNMIEIEKVPGCRND